MSQRSADTTAKVARSFYALPRMTDNVLSASLGQLTGLSGEVVKHSNVVKSFSLPALHTPICARSGFLDDLPGDAFAAFAKDVPISGVERWFTSRAAWQGGRRHDTSGDLERLRRCRDRGSTCVQ